MTLPPPPATPSPPADAADRLPASAALPVWRLCWRWAWMPLIYFLGAKLGVAYTVMPEGGAIVWPPNSALLAALLLHPWRHAPVLAVLALAAEVAADLPTFGPGQALAFGLVNVAEALLARALLQRWGFDVRLARLRDLAGFALLAGGSASFLAALAGAALYHAAPGNQAPYLELLRVWWLGDALGLLLFTPLWLGLAQWGGPGPRARVASPDALLLAGTVLALALLAAGSLGHLAGMPVTPVLMLPLLLGLATRFSLPVVQAAAVATAALVMALLTAGHHPFGSLPAREAVRAAQEFVLLIALVPMGLVALLAQLRSRRAELLASAARLTEANQQLEARVRERTATLDTLNAELLRLALVDPLTEVANRRAFYRRAEEAFAERRRHEVPLALLLVDVDHFKAVNDRLGHAGGDVVLHGVAARMAQALRPSDVLARIGGEEFAVLVQHTDAAGVVQLAERLRRAVGDAPMEVMGAPLCVTVSIGAACCQPGTCGLDDLMRRADAALYRAKASGRNRVELAEPAAPA